MKASMVVVQLIINAHSSRGENQDGSIVLFITLSVEKIIKKKKEVEIRW